MNDLPEYRPVSRLAVVALAGGIASALAVVSPAFLAVPLVGLALALAAFRDLGQDGAAKAGRLAAVAGLALSVGFAAQSLAMLGTSRWLAGRRAAAAARFWVDTICAERLDDARSMCDHDADAAIARLAACCGGAGVTTRPGRAGDRAGSWVVEVRLGGCSADVVLAPEATTSGGRPAERWLVVGCDVAATDR